MNTENKSVIFNICSLSSIYNDISETLRFGISELGYQVQCSPSILNSAVNILQGCHTFSDSDWDIIPKNSIIYNLEQLGSPSVYITDSYIKHLRNHSIWDYSERNIAWLKSQGINDSAIHVPIGYAPTLSRIIKSEYQDIDVLFYGWMNERRQIIIRELQNRGLNVVSLNKSFGLELDQYISRAKVVINIHFYETKIFEIVRVSYLLANRKAVISEVDHDTEIDSDLRDAVVSVSYDELADACQAFVDDDSLRYSQEEKAFERFSVRSQANYLRPAMDKVLDSNSLNHDNLELISVIIPCYNQATFLREAVESVIAQSYPNVEIIVVNDGSPDDTNLIANSLISEYPGYSIKLLEKANGGLVSARNMGISNSNGSYILTLDADDKIHPDMLRKCYLLLNDNPGISIAYTDYQHFGDADLVVNTPEYDFQVLYTTKCLHTATALYRKNAWIDARGYNPNMIWGMEDWEFWINCGSKGHFGKRVPEVLFYYRARLSEESMLRKCKAYSDELISRMVLNHQHLYDSVRITWAKHFWSDALVRMLEDTSKDSKEFSYLCNLNVLSLISEAEILIATEKRSKAIDLYRLWLENNQSPLAYAIYFNLGVYLSEENRLNEAKAAYRKSIAENPGFVSSIVNLNKLNKCNNFGVTWIDIEFDFECEIHHCFPRTGSSPTAFKVLNITTEPSKWCISSEELRKVAHNFDLILTYRDELADLPNVKFLLFGGCHVHQKPQVKRFEVSFLYSVGLNNDMSGYQLRKRVWEIKRSLPQTFKYFSSAIRPPVENDNPWPYAAKDKLFESMFSLIIENTSERNYFTEKIIDAFQTYTVPIYWGCPNISDYFDENGIICFDDVNELMQLIGNLTVDDYYSILESVSHNYNESLKYKDILSNMKYEIDSAYYSIDGESTAIN